MTWAGASSSSSTVTMAEAVAARDTAAADSPSGTPEANVIVTVTTLLDSTVVSTTVGMLTTLVESSQPPVFVGM